MKQVGSLFRLGLAYVAEKPRHDFFAIYFVQKLAKPHKCPTLHSVDKGFTPLCLAKMPIVVAFFRHTS
jgi:hypothetical protein